MTLPLAGLVLCLVWWKIFGACAARPAFRACLDRSTGLTLEMLLYSESPGLLGRVLGDVSLASVRLGGLLLWPSLLSLLAMLAVLAPLHWLCVVRPPAVGEAFLVSLPGQVIDLPLPPGLSADGPGLWVEADKATYWRLRAQQGGVYALASGQVWIGPGWVRPGRGPLQVHYPQRDIWLGDYPMPLWLGLVLWSLIWSACGLLIRPLLARLGGP